LLSKPVYLLALEGGNEYREGRLERDSRVWKGQRIKGKLSRRVDLEGAPDLDGDDEELSNIVVTTVDGEIVEIVEDAPQAESWEDIEGWHEDEEDEPDTDRPIGRSTNRPTDQPSNQVKSQGNTQRRG
jgi:hypothetical protein